MPRVHSHYENLKVARDAPSEDIRAAYRALTRRHHPDRNPDDAEAQRIMSVVNVAYAVLSDPGKRREHDAWIRQAEGPSARPVRERHTLHTPTATSADHATPELDDMAERRARRLELTRRLMHFQTHVLGHRLAYAGAAFAVLCGLIGAGRALRAPGLDAQLTAPAPGAAAKPTGYVRPAAAPNGHAWPARSGYVEGYPLLNNEGHAELAIDNSRNDADMFAKLVSLDGPTALPVRTVFVAAHARLRITDLSIGTYDLRYRDLASGGLLRSPAFILDEATATGSTQRSATTVPLYPAGGGNLQTYELGEGEFL